jgi:hypothetical protein
MIELSLRKIINATPQEIEAWGSFWSKILMGFAAVVGAAKAPEAISQFAATIKVESIVQGTLSNVSKIISTNTNTNTQIIQIKKDAQAKLQEALPDPEKFKQTVEVMPAPLLKELGLSESKQSLVSDLRNARTAEDVKQVVKRKIPNLLTIEGGDPITNESGQRLQLDDGNSKIETPPTQ